MNIDFLTSNRFWVLILGSLSATLIDPSFPTQAWYISVGKFLALVSGGFITVGTVDRFGEQVGGNTTGKSSK